METKVGKVVVRSVKRVAILNATLVVWTSKGQELPCVYRSGIEREGERGEGREREREREMFIPCTQSTYGYNTTDAHKPHADIYTQLCISVH